MGAGNVECRRAGRWPWAVGPWPGVVGIVKSATAAWSCRSPCLWPPGKGMMIKITRELAAYAARVNTFVAIYSCSSVRDP